MRQKKINLNLIVFELTEACNQQCKFCYNHWKGTDEPNLQETPISSDAKKTLKKIFKQAKTNSISFSGGEPMLHPDIHDLVLYSRFQRANVSVLTNGTLLTESDLSVFKELGVNKVQIPILSANPAIHDELTQVQGSWKKAVSNAEKIIKTNSEKFNAVLVLTKQNILNIEETLSFYESLGVKTALVNRFNIGGLGRKHRDELELSHSELKKVFEQINNFGKARSIRFFSGVCTPMCILNPADYPYIGFSFCNKDVSSRPITINTKGDVRFCNHSPNVLGNIFEKSLKDILYSDTYNSYFNTTPEYCASCSLLTLCQGGCRAASEQLYNTFSKADPVVDIK